MQRLILLLVSLAMVVPFGALRSLAGEPGGDKPKRRAGTVLYSPKADATAAQKAALDAQLKKHGLQQVKKLVKGKVLAAKAGAGNAASEEELCKALVATGAVTFAEPDYLVAPVTVPNDPGYGQQWHHPKIGTPAAWDNTKGSASVVVAVLDTGVQADHPDLAANLMLPGRNTVDDSEETSPVHAHGTMTAGCVGAVGNNTVGVAGVAWTVKILPVRISNRPDGSAYITDMAEGITWAADQGAKVANLSYGGANSSTIDSAAQYLRGKGGLLFMAAGNDGREQRRYPDFTSFVAVGATDANDAKTSWSTYGTFVDVVAPGAGIVTTTTGSAYAAVDGTSFSSPIAAGLAALIYSLDADFTPAQVEGFIFSTCKDLGAAGEDKVYGHGRIDAAAAVAKAKTLAGGNQPPVAAMTATPTGGDAPLNVSFDSAGSSDPEGHALAYAWDFGDGGTATGATATHEYVAPGAYTAKLVVTDNQGATAAATQVITVVDPNVLNAPSNLTATVVGSSVDLFWTDNSTNEAGFEIQRGVKAKGSTSWGPVDTVGPNVTTCSDTVADGTYQYRVRAFSDTATSAWSDTVSVSVGSTGKPPKK